MALDPKLAERALLVSAQDIKHSVARTIIGDNNSDNSAVVIYDLDDPPKWLKPILDMRDENGDVISAMVDCDQSESPMYVTVEYAMDASLDPRTSHADKVKAGLLI
jgi:hypothetical protein